MVQIGDGEYRISAIPDSTTLTICNDGDGITPGTTVEARTTSGLYQYPIVSLVDCCPTVTAAIADINDGLDTLTSWTPVFTSSTALTVTATAINYAKWGYIGTNRVWWALRATLTLGGSAATSIIHDLPIAFANQYGDGDFSCKINDSGTITGQAEFVPPGDSLHVRMRRYDNSNINTGAGKIFSTGGIYEV